MPTVAAGTIAAKRALPYARVLAESFREHHPEVPFFVLLADEVQGRFDPETEPFELLSLRDLAIPALPRLCFGYTEQPLSYACTPYLLAGILDRGFSRVLFLKQESLVVSDQSPAFSQLERHSILLTPHLLDPLTGTDGAERELNILQSGVFNGGLVGVSDTPTARRFLAWWGERVYAHCRHAVADGVHYEQRWLDLVPIFFDDVCIERDPRANIGHWSLPERLGEEPRLLRFSGFDLEHPGRVTRYNQRLSLADLGSAAERFSDYAAALLAAGWREARHWPYAYGSFDNGVPIPNLARELYVSLGAAVEGFGDPFETNRPGSYFAWLNEGVNGNGSLTRFWAYVHGLRADLQEAFPEPAGRDGRAFIDWAASSGLHEHQVSAAFIPQ